MAICIGGRVIRIFSDEAAEGNLISEAAWNVVDFVSAKL
jgi:hypothetical protein